MLDTARLDSIIKSHTALDGFADLLATSPSYIPTLNVGYAPDLIHVAHALVLSGRDAYVTGNGSAFFAKAKFDEGFRAPELGGSVGLVVPELPKPSLPDQFGKPLTIGCGVNFPSSSNPGGRRDGKVIKLGKSRVTVAFRYKNGRKSTKTVPAIECVKHY